MSVVEDRLSSLGLTLPTVAAPVAAYVPAVRTGTLIYTSGQLPFVDGSLPETGTVGIDVTPERAAELASICALNAMAAIKELIGDLDNVVRVVKVVGFVNSAPDFLRTRWSSTVRATCCWSLSATRVCTPDPLSEWPHCR